MLYPLKFKPRFVEKIWGGRKIETVLGKPLPAGRPIGESWELYDFPPGVVDNSAGWISAEVANGPLAGRTLHSLVQEFGEALHGDVPLSGEHGQFPILIKFLDAKEDLSVQVHPPQPYCDANPGAHLKSEAWYVFQHDPGSRILKGLKDGVTRERFEKGIADGTVEDQICAIPVKDGECYYLPSGTVHALGGGILAAEVQTPSDTTFRVFDFNRIEKETGKPRKLHVKQALDCIDFDGKDAPHAEPADAPSTRLVTSPYFHLEKVRMPGSSARSVPGGSPVVWMMLAGGVRLATAGLAEATSAVAGETVLFPANVSPTEASASKDSIWLEVTFPA
jgi:mannose-6-phosphate isomerase